MSDDNKSKKESEPINQPCPEPDCDYVGKAWNGFRGHMRMKHGWTKDQIAEVVPDTATRKAEKMMKQRIEQTVQNMMPTNIQPGNAGPKLVAKVRKPLVDESNVTRLDVSELKGQLRQALQGLQKLPDEKRSLLLPQREQIMDAIRDLRKASLTPEDYEEIKSSFEDVIKPTIENITGRTRTSSGVLTEDGLVDTAMDVKRSRLQSEIRALLRTITGLSPSNQSQLAGEKENITMLNRKLMSTNLNKKEIKDIEAILLTEIKPIVETVSEEEGRGGRKTKSYDGVSDDFLDDMMDMKKQEYNRTRMDRMIAQEQLQQKQVIDALAEGNRNGSSGSAPPGMMPVTRQLMENGELIYDKNGKPVMETTYVMQGGMDNGMARIVEAAIKRPDDKNDMIPLLVTSMQENTKMQLAMMQGMMNNKGTDVEKLLLELDSRQKDLMMTLFANKNEASSETRKEIEAMRAQQMELQSQLYQTQMGHMKQEMEELKHMAYQDPVERMVRQKSQLEAAGMIRSEGSNTEQETIKEMGKMFNTASDKVDSGFQAVTELLRPLTMAQAENLKQRGGLKAPTSLNDRERAMKYKELLEGLESVE